MSLPRPVPGLVLNYSFLWVTEQTAGLEEGSKSRPCAVVVVSDASTSPVVTVLPITHSPPLSPDGGIEIPTSVKQRLGLDLRQSWILTSHTNVFAWPGPDLRPRNPSDPSSVAYGYLPGDVLFELRRRLYRANMGGVIDQVRRTE